MYISFSYARKCILFSALKSFSIVPYVRLSFTRQDILLPLESAPVFGIGLFSKGILATRERFVILEAELKDFLL